jgi:hypothetical protein
VLVLYPTICEAVAETDRVANQVNDEHTIVAMSTGSSLASGLIIRTVMACGSMPPNIASDLLVTRRCQSHQSSGLSFGGEGCFSKCPRPPVLTSISTPMFNFAHFPAANRALRSA